MESGSRSKSVTSLNQINRVSRAALFGIYLAALLSNQEFPAHHLKPNILIPGLRGFSYLARPAGLEPATPGLEGRCSIRLSYGRIAFSNQIRLWRESSDAGKPRILHEM